VGGGGDNISVIEGRWDNIACYQPTDMSHISQKDSFLLVTNLQEKASKEAGHTRIQSKM